MATKQPTYYERTRQVERAALDRDHRAAMTKRLFTPQPTPAHSAAPQKSGAWWQRLDWEDASPDTVNAVLVSLAVSLHNAIKAERAAKGETARYFKVVRLKSKVTAQIRTKEEASAVDLRLKTALSKLAAWPKK